MKESPSQNLKGRLERKLASLNAFEGLGLGIPSPDWVLGPLEEGKARRPLF